jgi:hypothetical protein
MCNDVCQEQTHDTEARGHSPVEAATTRLKTSLESLEKAFDILRENLSPVLIPAQPNTTDDSLPRPDYPGESPVVRDISFCAEQVGDLIQAIERTSGRLEI